MSGEESLLSTDAEGDDGTCEATTSILSARRSHNRFMWLTMAIIPVATVRPRKTDLGETGLCCPTTPANELWAALSSCFKDDESRKERCFLLTDLPARFLEKLVVECLLRWLLEENMFK